MTKIFLAGGTGFVGRQITQDLLNNEYHVRCLVRKGSESKPAAPDRVETAYGDIGEPHSLKEAMEGCGAVINLVGIIREFPNRGITFERLHYEGTRNLVDEAKRQGIKKFIQMSALGADINARTVYHRTKARAEDHLKLSGLRYTIFRPSIIFGSEDKFVNLFADMMRKLPVIPVIGSGKYMLQPVSVKNVSEGFVRAIEFSETDDQVYEAGGPDKMEFNAILDTIGKTLGKRVRKVHIPSWFLKPAVKIMERFRFFPLTSDQMKMLLEGNICDERRFFETFRIKPIIFREEIRSYIK
ncbi:MAG: complex I NDUFA9 subunit family protein [Acidobacteriota bacterium]